MWATVHAMLLSYRASNDGERAFFYRGHIAEDHCRLSAEARKLTIRKIVAICASE